VSLDTKQAGPKDGGPPPGTAAAGQSFGEETVPLRAVEEREAERHREERVRVVVGRAPGHRWRFGRRTALALGAASLLLGAVAVVALAGPGAREPSPTTAAERPRASHALTVRDRSASTRLTDRRQARRRAVTRAHRAAARRQRRAAARRAKRQRARSSGKDAGNKSAPPPPSGEAPTTEPPAESAAPAPEAPTVATPQAGASEPTTSVTEQSQTQKEFGFER
jgi:hypothetical protein